MRNQIWLTLFAVIFLFACSSASFEIAGEPSPDVNDADVTSLESGDANDAEAADTEAADTGAADTGAADTGAVDTGTADTGTADTGMVDTETVDTGTVDTGVIDTAPPCTGVDKDHDGYTCDVDCDDNDDRVHPESGVFDTPYYVDGAPHWDYNCNGKVEKYTTALFDGSEWACKNACYGYLDKVAECGEVKPYVNTCKWNGSSCVITTYLPPTQKCR